MAKGLDAAAAQDLIEHGLTSLGGKAVAAKAKPVIEAALETARQSVRASGRRSLTINGISVHSGDRSTTVFQIVGSGPQKPTPIGAGPERDIPIAYGGTGYTCYLVSKGPPPYYFCIYF